MLNATTQLVQTQRDLKRARYDFLLAALRLKASTAALTDEDVAGVNALLEDKALPLTVPDVLAPERTPRSLVPPANPPARTAPTSGISARPTVASSDSSPSSTAKPTRAKRR